MTDSEVPSPLSDDTPETAAANARLGLQLFAIYFVLYAGFMLGSAFAPGFMASTPFGGLNVALIYGIGLIKAAILMALFYVVLCGRSGRRLANQANSKGDSR